MSQESFQTISYSIRVHVRSYRRILPFLPMESKRQSSVFRVRCWDQCLRRIRTDTFRLSGVTYRWERHHRTVCLLRDRVLGHVLFDRYSSRVIVNNVSFGINVNGIFKLSVTNETCCGCGCRGELDINGKISLLYHVKVTGSSAHIGC